MTIKQEKRFKTEDYAASSYGGAATDTYVDDQTRRLQARITELERVVSDREARIHQTEEALAEARTLKEQATNSLTREIVKKDARIERLETDVQQERGAKIKVMNDLADASSRIVSQSSDIQKLKQSNESLKKEVSILNTKVARAEQVKLGSALSNLCNY